jgi:hypothetical protein
MQNREPSTKSLWMKKVNKQAKKKLPHETRELFNKKNVYLLS